MSWTTVPASELMVKRGGSINPSKHPEEVFDLLSIPAFDNGEVEVLQGSEIGSSKSCVEPNDVLLSKIIPHIRRCWVVPARGPNRQIGSGEWIIFRDDRFNTGFLKHFLTSDRFHMQFMNTVAGVGGSLVRARPAFVERIDVPLPPMEEQKHIAAILDKADNLRRKRREAIQLADEFLRAVFLDMFGDPVTNPKGWEKVAFETLLDGIESGASPKCESRPAKKGEWGVLKLGAVSYCVYRPGENKAMFEGSVPDVRHEVQQGDLLFTRKNTYELVAASAIVEETPERLLLPDLIFRFQTNSRVNKFYLWALLTHSGMRRLIQSLASGAAGSMPNISKANLRSVSLCLPPISEQEKFEIICRKIWNIKKKLSEVMNIPLFESLSQKAFSGEL